MKNNLFFLLLLILTSCGFSSNYYGEILRAQEYIDNRDYKKAAEIYENTLQQKLPKVINIKIHYQLAEIYSIYLADFKKAIKYYSQLSEISNEASWHIKSYEKMGLIYQNNLKDYKKALFVYSKLLEFKPELKNKVYYQYRLSENLLLLGKYKESLKNFLVVLNSNDKKLANESLYFIGLNHFYLRDWDEANKNWFSYLKTETRQDKVQKTKFLIANSFENNEKLREAYNMYYSLLGNYPNNEVIKKRLESLYNRRVARKR